ncbi:MAG: MFS transporter [Myxococcota bacterium]|nr:MFS transporter [Myxococcota bacterium]
MQPTRDETSRADDGDSDARPGPIWLRPFFGDQRVAPGPMRTLLLVSLGLAFETYDIGLISAALPQISADLGIPSEGSGFYLGLIRLGGIGTILFMALADGAGRRRVFLGCLVAMSLGTFATALAQTPFQFAAAQMATRVFMLTAASLALVILVEEFPAELRGGAVAMLNLLGGIGFGLGAGLYAAVDVLPFGWRALYVVGLLPVFLLPFFRSSLKETRRFEEQQQQSRPGVSEILRGWLDPLGLLLRTHPGRVAAVGAAGLFSAMAFIGFGQYTSLYLQHVHGWSPAAYSQMILGGGILAALGNVVGGRGSDVFGRRPTGFLLLGLTPLMIAAFYAWAESSVVLVLTWALGALCIVGGGVVIRAVTTELFPTSHRSSAAGWLIFVETLGWVAGLFLIDFLTERPEELPRWIATIGAAGAVSAVAILFVPETGSVELEAISED